MKPRLTEIAQEELESAVARYNDESPGLGFEFADEVYRSIDKIVAHPQAWRQMPKRTRRCVMRRFPYGIFYQVRADEILIVSVMHLHRHPQSWRSNL